MERANGRESGKSCLCVIKVDGIDHAGGVQIHHGQVSRLQSEVIG